MKVAQIAPLYESVPPKQYGGTERVVSYLTEELIRQGHEVTLFASGDSVTAAQLIPGSEKSLRLFSGCEDNYLAHVLMFEEVRRRASDFDIIHSHVDYTGFSIARSLSTPSITTLHGRLDLPQLVQVYGEYDEAAVVSISEAQRLPLPAINWKKTVYHGLPQDLYRPHPRHKGYAAFVGRIAVEKRPDRAIKIANRLGLPLKIAAKISNSDLEYYETVIRPLIDKSHDVEFVGEINDAEKNDFIGNAAMLLFPIDWPEPFGLVMIEAMACGTPVIAYRNGSVPEIIEDGISGYVVDSLEEAVRAGERILESEISRSACRREFEKRFTVETMAKNYLSVYKKLINEEQYVARSAFQNQGASLNPLRGWDAWKTSSNMPMTPM